MTPTPTQTLFLSLFAAAPSFLQARIRQGKRNLSFLTTAAFVSGGNSSQNRRPQLLTRRHFSGVSTDMWMKKLHSPSADRNKEPIWEVMEGVVLPQLKTAEQEDKVQVLEVAAGCGVHTHHLVAKLCEWNKTPFYWQSTDPELSARESQEIYIGELSPDMQKSVSATPLSLTLSSNGIEEESTQAAIQSSSLDLIININMIHISPWSATEGLLKMAKEKLKAGGLLYLYGPFKVDGTASASNLKFDQYLRAKDPGYGVRNLEDVVALAKSENLQHLSVTKMPANNLSVLFRRQE